MNKSELPTDHHDGSRNPINSSRRINSFSSYPDYLAAYGGSEENAGMVLNHLGQVVCCNEAAEILLGTTSDKLAGQHVQQIMPGIRLKRDTPGSNIAFATYCGKTKAWREHRIVGFHESPILLEVSMDILALQGRYLIMIGLRRSKDSE